MATLEEYRSFLAVVQEGSLTAAAKRLGRSLQAVSRALGALEHELGTMLVARTTRSCRPTAEGLLFARRIGAALADIDVARTELAAHGGRVAGHLTIGASTLFGPDYVVPVLAAFAARYPDCSVALALSDRHEDLRAGDIDLAVRIGAPMDDGLMLRRLGTLRRVVFGAPGYFAARGRPASPAALADHDCIVETASGGGVWQFAAAGGMTSVAVQGRFRSDSAPARNEAAAQGLGIARAPLWQVRRLLEAGRIELVLTEFEPPPLPIGLVWPPVAPLPARLRAAIDFLAARLPVSGL